MTVEQDIAVVKAGPWQKVRGQDAVIGTGVGITVGAAQAALATRGIHSTSVVTDTSTPGLLSARVEGPDALKALAELGASFTGSAQYLGNGQSK